MTSLKPKNLVLGQSPKLSNPQPEPLNNSMPSFQFNIAPMGFGGFNARAVCGNQVGDSAITTANAPPRQNPDSPRRMSMASSEPPTQTSCSM